LLRVSGRDLCQLQRPDRVHHVQHRHLRPHRLADHPVLCPGHERAPDRVVAVSGGRRAVAGGADDARGGWAPTPLCSTLASGGGGSGNRSIVNMGMSVNSITKSSVSRADSVSSDRISISIVSPTGISRSCEICDEEHDAMHRCIDCQQSMCEAMGDLHRRMKQTKKHVLEDLAKLLRACEAEAAAQVVPPPPPPQCDFCDDEHPATHRCVNCDGQVMCTELAQMHRSAKASRLHTLEELPALSTPDTAAVEGAIQSLSLCGGSLSPAATAASATVSFSSLNAPATLATLPDSSSGTVVTLVTDLSSTDSTSPSLVAADTAATAPPKDPSDSVLWSVLADVAVAASMDDEDAPRDVQASGQQVAIGLSHVDESVLNCGSQLSTLIAYATPVPSALIATFDGFNADRQNAAAQLALNLAATTRSVVVLPLRCMKSVRHKGVHLFCPNQFLILKFIHHHA
jgi:hypothetical protein